MKFADKILKLREVAKRMAFILQNQQPVSLSEMKQLSLNPKTIFDTADALKEWSEVESSLLGGEAFDRELKEQAEWNAQHPNGKTCRFEHCRCKQ